MRDGRTDHRVTLDDLTIKRVGDTEVTFCAADFMDDKNYGIRRDGFVFVNPTIWHLIHDATVRELALITRALRVIDWDDPAVRQACEAAAEPEAAPPKRRKPKKESA